MMEFADFGFTPPDEVEEPSYQTIYNDAVAACLSAEPGTEYDLVEYVLEQYRDAADAMLAKLRAVEFIPCSICHRQTNAKMAHRHQGEWIGDDCCWDERLRGSE